MTVPREAMCMECQISYVNKPVKSFQQDMRAKIQLDQLGWNCNRGDENSLRQGCCMTPVLFNLYSCLVIKLWLSKGEGSNSSYVNHCSLQVPSKITSKV